MVSWWVLRKAGLRKKKQLGEDLPSARSKVWTISFKWYILVTDDSLFLQVTTSLDMEDVGIDDDVVAEDERLGKGFPPDSPVVIYKLRKEVNQMSSNKGNTTHILPLSPPSPPPPLSLVPQHWWQAPSCCCEVLFLSHRS